LFITCNRIEAYGCGIAPEFDYRYDHHGERDVYKHLVTLACGLKSQLLGERQIMDQLTAFSGIAGGDIGYLVAQAVAEAREIRGRFSIDAGHTAADAVYQDVSKKGLLGKRTIVVGAGVVAQMAAKRFYRESPLCFVSGKHRNRARELASRFHGEMCLRGDMETALEGARVLICATKSPHYVITRRDPVGECVIYDLSMPRNVEPSLGAIDLELLDGEFQKLNENMKERALSAVRDIEKRHGI
jgi:glutamyl-tRNA reductase